MCDKAELLKKLYTALAKGSESELPDLLVDCDCDYLASFAVLSNSSVQAQAWSAELAQLVRNSQMQGLVAHLASGRAAAIQAAHGANNAAPTADDVATYIMEDLAHKCVACCYKL